MIDLLKELSKNYPDNIKIEEVEDYHLYPIADNDTPKLSSDRLEYSLSNALFTLLKSIVWFKTSSIKNFLNGADCLSTINLFKQLGVDINFLDNNTVTILGGKLNKPLEQLNAGNSGTTMRLVTGVLSAQDFDSIIIGDESLSKRPMRRIIEPLTLMGADISSMDGKAPLYIRGTRLHGMEYISLISSAQVKSCVLLAGLNERTKGETVYIEPGESFVFKYPLYSECFITPIWAGLNFCPFAEQIITYGWEATCFPGIKTTMTFLDSNNTEARAINVEVADFVNYS